MATRIDLEEVIAAAQAHDPVAFDALVDEYTPRLYGFLYRLTGDRADSEDLVQEVFVRVVRTIDRYEEAGRFEAWLFRIAGNLARDRIRRIRRTPDIASLDAVDGAESEARPAGATIRDAGGQTPDGRAERAEELDRLQRALLAIPESEREIVMLRHCSSMTFAEIAEMLDIPLGTALARSHRGLRKLRELMEGDR